MWRVLLRSGSSGFRAMSPPVRLWCYMRNCSMCVCVSQLTLVEHERWDARWDHSASQRRRISPINTAEAQVHFYISPFSCIQLNQLREFFFFPFPPSFSSPFHLFSPSSKRFESISCPTNAVYPLGCETSALSSHWLLELFLHTHSLRLFFFFFFNFSFNFILKKTL